MEALDETWVAAEIEALRALGPRLTGTPAHDRLVDRVTAQLRALGLAVDEDRHAFTRWDLTAEPSLVVGGVPAEVASVFPYSGTGSASGPLVRLRGPLPRWSRARDGIAVVEVNNRELPARHFIDTWDADQAWPPVAHPLIPATIAGLGLGRARRAGVRAVVFAWRGLDDAGARDQYVPFTLPYQDIPAVFVSGASAAAVLAAEANATLTVPAALTPNATMRTVWTVIEGAERPDETVLVVTHTDGTNTVEENGHIGLLALAGDLVRTQPRRTVVLAFIAGHLRIPAVTSSGQAGTRWLDDHPDLWSGAVAGLAVEHLGARSRELLYATTPGLRHLAENAFPGTALSRPNPLIHFGEGEPLLHKRIPAVSLVSTPTDLLSTQPGDHVERAAGRQAGRRLPPPPARTGLRRPRRPGPGAPARSGAQGAGRRPPRPRARHRRVTWLAVPVAGAGGATAPGFHAVRDAFAVNSTDHGEIGAADLDRRWQRDTLQAVYSTTKGATSACALLLAQRGELDLDAPAREHWPEFAARDKQDIPVRWLLTHQAGLSVLGEPVPLAWDPVRAAPGLGEFFRAEIAEPAGLDFWIGLPRTEHHRLTALASTHPCGGAPATPCGARGRLGRRRASDLAATARPRRPGRARRRRPPRATRRAPRRSGPPRSGRPRGPRPPPG
ncbi:serine hydrolase [Actinokineospora sp. G85]|uniref:serine hydrolase n=1 Tax=Actinokineospora sp. G85 TaxID=3406626 RepID=UPI003C774894